MAYVMVDAKILEDLVERFLENASNIEREFIDNEFRNNWLPQVQNQTEQYAPATTQRTSQHNSAPQAKTQHEGVLQNSQADRLSGIQELQQPTFAARTTRNIQNQSSGIQNARQPAAIGRSYERQVEQQFEQEMQEPYDDSWQMSS